MGFLVMVMNFSDDVLLDRQKKFIWGSIRTMSLWTTSWAFMFDDQGILTYQRYQKLSQYLVIVTLVSMHFTHFLRDIMGWSFSTTIATEVLDLLDWFIIPLGRIDYWILQNINLFLNTYRILHIKIEELLWMSFTRFNFQNGKTHSFSIDNAKCWCQFLSTREIIILYGSAR